METVVKTKKHNIEKNGIDVFKTDDYDMFKTLKGNRPINESLVNKIYESIRENGWFESSIIIIGEGMRVLDGQHRIEALKKFKKAHERGYKVRYIVDRNLDDLKKVQAFNNNKKPWSHKDYLISFMSMGNENYIQYAKFLDEFKLSHTVGLALTMSGRNQLKHNLFKLGKFTCNDWGASKVYAEYLNDVRKYFNHAHTGTFVRSIILFWRHPDFKHKDFIHKLSLNREMLYRTGSTESYIKLISDIYNWKNHNKIKFLFQ